MEIVRFPSDPDRTGPGSPANAPSTTAAHPTQTAGDERSTSDAQVRTGLRHHRGGRGGGAGRAQSGGSGHGFQSPRGAADRRGSDGRQHGSLRVPQPGQAQHPDDRVQLDPGRRPRRRPQLVHVLAQRPLQRQDRPDRGRPGGHHVRVPLQDRYRPALPRQHHAVVHGHEERPRLRQGHDTAEQHRSAAARLPRRQELQRGCRQLDRDEGRREDLRRPA